MREDNIPCASRRNERSTAEKHPVSGEHPGFVRCLSGFAFEVRSGCARSLAVGFAAVFYGGDADDVSVVMEADAVVAYPQPELRRLDVLETLNVAFAAFQIVGQRMENTEGSGLIDGAKLSLGLVVPDNVLAHAYRPVL